MAQLPSDSLLKYATTQDLIKRWLKAKSHALWLGKCLKARFGGGGGNPAKKALKAGHIDQFDYTAILAVVELHATTFALIQTAWEEIQESISCIKNSPNSETELFFEILREGYDIPFMRIVKGCKRIAKKGELLAKLGRNAVWQHSEAIDPDWDGMLTPEESAIVNPLLLNRSDFSWYTFVTHICKEAAKKDIEIKRQLRRHFDAIGYVCDLLVQAHRRERSLNPPRRFRSERWENGRCRIGKKGGFESAIESEAVPSVTELNETISNIICRSYQY